MKRLLAILTSALVLSATALVFTLPASASANYCQIFDSEIGLYLEELYGETGYIPSSWSNDFVAYRTFKNVADSDMTIEEQAAGTKYTVPSDTFEGLAKDLFGSNSNSENLKAATGFKFYTFSYDEENSVYVINKGAGGGGSTNNFYTVGYSDNGGSYSVYLYRLIGSSQSKDALKTYLADNNITFDESKYIVTNDGIHSYKSDDCAKIDVSYSGETVKFMSISPVSSAPDNLTTWPNSENNSSSSEVESGSSENNTSSNENESSSSETDEVSSKNESSSSNSSSKNESSSSQDSSSSKPESNTSSSPTKKPNSSTSSSTASIPSITPSGFGSILAITDAVIVEAEDGVFPEDVVVSVSALTDGELYNIVSNALSSIAAKFTAYDITATAEDTSVQPDGTVKATFVIPEGYNTDRLSIVYIAEDGEVTVLPCTVDKGSSTISTDLPHFSTYAVIETLETTSTEQSNSWLSGLWIIPVVLLSVLLVATAIWYFLYFRKKTVIYEGPKTEVSKEDAEENI